ncbi:MAG: hypothetical protein AVDCRST_MAG91-2644 [uncultured Sphingomonadaceae bacterium]|uniref:PilZ domain-containing protein n=1 Tax=uncultured Sphingomonadaceae bacterium TaxID=169976 RepID=A0A6J4TMC7_9SPHN|nr:MAG: hypothetical protein AVDCRST_MAG91-2644 [uncultured Sphingomonadaceae bacterium]
MRILAKLTAQSGADRRRSPRNSARFANDEGPVDVVVVTDLSPEGARLITPAPMDVGRHVSLNLPLFEPVEGRIAWVSSRMAGCEFAEPIHPAALRVLLAASS